MGRWAGGGGGGGRFSPPHDLSQLDQVKPRGCPVSTSSLKCSGGGGGRGDHPPLLFCS